MQKKKLKANERIFRRTETTFDALGFLMNVIHDRVLLKIGNFNHEVWEREENHRKTVLSEPLGNIKVP